MEDATEEADNKGPCCMPPLPFSIKARPHSSLLNLNSTGLCNCCRMNREEYDRRQAALSVAHAKAIQSASDVHQSRASLGLVARPESGELGEVPANIDQTFSSLGVAQAALIQTAGQLGVAHSYEQLPKEMLKQFFK